jgi:hypothetical protein
VLRRYGFGFVARGRRERVFEFTFFLFFEKIRRLKLFFFSLFWREERVREKGLFYFCRRTHLFSARGGCSGDGSETIKRAKKDFPRCLFPGSSGVWMRIALKPLERLDVLRALDGIAAGGRSFPSLSRFWIWAKIFFFVGVTRIRRRNESLSRLLLARRTLTHLLSHLL